MSAHPPMTSVTDQSSPAPFSTDRHCVFRCQDNWFALPATVVREIANAPDVSVVPGSHPSLAGLCHLRSEFLPVIRIDALMGESAADASGDRKLLVLSSNSGPWAILISEVAALVALETLASGDLHHETGNGVVMGTAMHNDEVVRVLDVHQLQRWSQTQLEEFWQGAVYENTPSVN